MKIPKNLGRYEVLDLISEGGMGTLFRARDPRIGRNVAVKVLKKDFDTPELRDRFSREARAAGCLSHPNIVTIYDVGEHDGLPFIAMEYVRGETFAEVIGLRPPLSVERKLQLVEEVCAGLAHAHEAGIVHRDIKPANLILSSEGLVKILDFGIAKLSSAGLTMPGVIMGTLAYMSPEQAKGDPVDARTDIFAVGVVTYELLSHQAAFSGTRPSEVLHKILSGTPTPITQFCPDLDVRLVEVIDRTLEKDPDKRFQTIAAVQRAIEAVRMDLQMAAAPWPPRPSRLTRPTGNRAANDPARVRAEQVDAYLAQSARAFDTGDYDAAIEACKQVLMLDASNERAFAELDRIHAAADARQAAVQAAVERGRAALQNGDIMSAQREARQALALDPYDADARALGARAEQAIAERQEEARVRSAIDAARRRFAAGDHEAAIQALQALPGSNPLVRASFDEFRREMARIEEQRRIAAAQAEARRRVASLAADARMALDGNRLDEAAKILAAIRDIDAAAPEAADLAERVRQAQAAARAREEIGRILAEFDARLADNQLARARELIDAASAVSAADPRLPAARRRFTDAAAAQAAAEARKREGESALDAAAARLKAGDLDAAGNELKRAAELVPGHQRAAALTEQLRVAREQQAAAEAAARLKRKVDDLVRSASAHLEAGADNPANLSSALHDVSRALELDASSVEAAQVKTKIEAAIAARREAARARAAVDNAGRRFAMGKHAAAIKLLEEFDPPTQPDVVKALGELRAALQVIEERRRAEQERAERQQRAASMIADARAALDQERFDDALRLTAGAEELDATNVEIAPLREQIAAGQAAARRRAEVAAIVADFDQRLAAGNLEAARDLVARAVALDANDPAVANARQRVDQAFADREAAAAREREAAAEREREAALQREREAVAAREHEAALQREREATATRERQVHAPPQKAAHPPSAADPDAETLFAGGLQDAVRAAMTDAGHVPQRPATPPPTQKDDRPEQPSPDATNARRKADELLVAARAQLNESNASLETVASALEKIGQALAVVPNDSDALALETTANERLFKLREAAKIEAAIRNAHSRFAIGKYQAAIQLLESLDPDSHPAVAAALSDFRNAVKAMEERRRRAQAPPTPKPPPDDDATRVIFVPDMAALRAGQGAAPPTQPPAAVGVPRSTAPELATSQAAVSAPLPLHTVAPPAPSPAMGAPRSDAESRRRLLIGAGVLLLALVIALLMLRFAA